MGGLGTADRGSAAAGQDAAQEAAADGRGSFLAVLERREVAQHPRRAWSVVAGGTVVYPLVFIRWAKQGVWERLLDLVQQHDIVLGMTVIDGTSIRAHHKVNLVQQPALILDRMGFVLDCNAAAAEMFDDDLRVSNRRLTVRSREGRAALDALLNQMRATAINAGLPVAPIIVQRRGKRPVLIRILPISGVVRSPFLGARALLMFSGLEPKSAPDPRLLSSLFGLTPAEARLASLIAGGVTPETAALQLKISPKTARNQLMAVFDKTETHRQSELAVLLAPLCRLLLLLLSLLPGVILDFLVSPCCAT